MKDELDAVMPIMGAQQFAEQISRAAGGAPSTALLVYGPTEVELVTGMLSAMSDEYSNTTFWVGDRCVAVLGRDGEVTAVPALRSLRTGYAYPVEVLTRTAVPMGPGDES